MNLKLKLYRSKYDNIDEQIVNAVADCVEVSSSKIQENIESLVNYFFERGYKKEDVEITFLVEETLFGEGFKVKIEASCFGLTINEYVYSSEDNEPNVRQTKKMNDALSALVNAKKAIDEKIESIFSRKN